MSLLAGVNEASKHEFYFASNDPGQNASNWANFPAVARIDASGYGIYNLSEVILNDGDIRGCSYLQIDAQILTADPTDLLLNGKPIATINDLPHIEEWANYDAINNVVMNGEGISGEPYSVLGAKSYGFSNNSALTCTGTLSSATLYLNGTPIAGSGVATTSQWAQFRAIQNVDFSGNEISNINKITFNTAIPGLGGASINALNDLYFSYATGLAGQAGITNVNNIAFWNPAYPGVPGFYANMYTKQLTYGIGPATTYICTDTDMAIPRLYLGGALGTAGGKLEILGQNATTATINGFPCSASWSQYNAMQAVNMNNNQLLNVYQINFNRGAGQPFNLLAIDDNGHLTSAGSPILTNPLLENVDMAYFGFDNLAGATFRTGVGAPQNVLTVDVAGNLTTRIIGSPPRILLANPLNDNLDVNTHTVNNVVSVNFTGGGVRNLTTNTDGNLTYNGFVITTGTEGDVKNWANYPAVNNVVIPSAFGFSINAANTLTAYKSCTLNANVYHGVQGNASAPDFISFPNTFQVGTTINPAREITMTAGALGFGINSDTEINIDAAGLLEMRSTAGVLTMESALEFNITAGALTTFEFLGEWNVASLATTWEIGAWNLTAGTVTAETGAVSWTAASAFVIEAPGIGLAGGIVTIGAAGCIIAGGGLSVAGGGVSIAAGGVSIAGGGLLVGGGVTNINGGASILNGLTCSNITGVKTLVGDVSSGAVLTNISSINGLPPGSGQQTFNLSVPVFTPPLISNVTPVKVYESASFGWNIPTKPVINVLVTGHISTPSTTNLFFFMQILVNGITLTNFNTVKLIRPVVVSPVTFQGVSYFTATWNDSYDAVLTSGTPFTLQLYALCDTGTVTYDTMSLEVNMTPSTPFS